VWFAVRETMQTLGLTCEFKRSDVVLDRVKCADALQGLMHALGICCLSFEELTPRMAPADKAAWIAEGSTLPREHCGEYPILSHEVVPQRGYSVHPNEDEQDPGQQNVIITQYIGQFGVGRE
jgi:hypothetical protein